MQIKIYTDGACRANGTKNALGGWAYTIIYNDEVSLDGWGNEKGTTNNRMEMMAVIEALKNFVDLDKDIILYTDSAYIHNCMKQKWYINWQKNGWVNATREPVKNKDLWEQIIPYFSNPLIHFEKVKGHSKNENEHEKWNNVVDRLAVNAAKALEE